MQNKGLKIGVVVDQLLPGGVQIAAIEEVKNLNKLGSKAELLILMRKKYSLEFQSLVKGVPHRFLSDSYPWPLRNTLKFPIFAFFSTLHLLSPFLAPRVVKEKEYDVLISHGTTTCFTTLALWRQRKIPYLAVIHDPIVYILKKVYSKTLLRLLFLFLIPLSYHLEAEFIKEALATIIVSSVHQSFLKKRYQIEPIILPHGCYVQNKIPPKRGNAILAISRWEKEKDPQFLLKLLEKIPNTKLIVAGVWLKEKDLNDFQQEVKRLNLENYLEIMNGFSDDELKDICKKARVWVHPHQEAFGMGAIEAAANGIPVVISAKSGAANIFENGIDGFFPKTITQKEFLSPLLTLLKDERLAYKMGKNAWLKVKNHYSWSAHALKLFLITEEKLSRLGHRKITAVELGHAGRIGLAGGDRLFEEMVKRLHGDPFKIGVVTSSFGGEHWDQAKLGVNLVRLPPNPFENNSDPVSVFLSYLIRIIQSSFYFYKHSVETEILYSSTNVLPDIFPCFIAKIINPKIKWLCRFHHLIPPPHRREGRLIVNIVSYLMQAMSLHCARNKADLTIALNKQLCLDLLKKRFDKEKLTVLGAGIDFTKIANYKPRKKESFDGIYLGRLHPAKGVFDTLHIWAEVVRENSEAKLAIIGDGPAEIKNELSAGIKTKNLTKNIQLFGYLPEPEIYNILKNGKVFLFTDHEAGWGLAVAEAMACGLPVVGWNIGVLGKVFKEGFIKIPCFQCKIFARKVLWLLDDKGVRLKMADQAFNQAKRLSWEETTNKFRKILAT